MLVGLVADCDVIAVIEAKGWCQVKRTVAGLGRLLTLRRSFHRKGLGNLHCELRRKRLEKRRSEFAHRVLIWLVQKNNGGQA
jgi:hypothetical protein